MNKNYFMLGLLVAAVGVIFLTESRVGVLREYTSRFYDKSPDADIKVEKISKEATRALL